MKTAGITWRIANVVSLLAISVLTATGRQAYGPKVSNIVTHVYIVDAITPVVMATMKSRPWGGKNGPSRDKKNQITARGRRNEKIVWPTRLPLRYRSRVSLAASGGFGRNENRCIRGAKESLYIFSDPTDSGLNSTIATPKRSASTAQEIRKFAHVNALLRSSGGKKSTGFVPVMAARPPTPTPRASRTSQSTRS